MVAFARFVMRDNGLAIHINAEHVTQVRQTIEGDAAIYIGGRDSAMIVEETVEGAIRMLEAASAGSHLDDGPEPPAVEAESPPTVARLAAPEITQTPSTPEAGAGAARKTKTSAKAKGAKAGAKAKAPAEDVVLEEAAAEPEAPYETPAWFVGNG
jgi:hypothetical protein